MPVSWIQEVVCQDGRKENTMSYNCAAVVMGNTVGDTWVRYLRTVIKHGEYYHDEGERIL